MLNYILRRILIFIPTLFVISLLAFVISVSSPVDPVAMSMAEDEGVSNDLQAYFNLQDTRQRMRERFNLHLPVFYLRVASAAEPDTLYKIYDQDRRKSLGKLLSQSGNWPAVQAYHRSLIQLKLAHTGLRQQALELDTNRRQIAMDAIINSSVLVNALMNIASPTGIENRFGQLDILYLQADNLKTLIPHFDQVRAAYAKVMRETKIWKTYTPKIIWYGSQNQYHKWITGILFHFDFGNSYKNMLPVSKRIGDLFFWSFIFTISSIVLAYLIAVPLGILGAAWHGSKFDRITTVIVFAMDSLPSFWLATLLLVTFANPDVLNWFPSSFNEVRLGDESLLSSFFSDINRLILPLIAYTYGQIAFISRLMRSSMLEVIRQDYVRTARAKGLRERFVLLRHALRNAALPLITRFAGVLPALIGGNVVLETIFSIPGMGREIFQACFDKDIPMIMAVFTLVGALAILGYLVSDLLYVLVDPRIKLKKEEN
jgi:peptide/nickel transport system permease protein